MNRRAIVLLVVALVLAGSRTRSLEFEAPQKDPFSFFGPAIQVDADERKRLAAGKTIAAILPAHDHELAVLAAGSTTATADALVNAVRHIVRLEKGSFIPEIGRFSKHPRVQDLATLTLDPIDLDAIKTCRPGACDLKLTAPEIDRLHRIVSAHPANPKHAVESEFRRIIVDRVTAYLRRGQRGIAPYGNGDDTPDLVSAFSRLMQDSPYIQTHAPQLARYFEQYPAARSPAAETFLYWSKEKVAKKSIISVTHVAIMRGDPQTGAPEVLVMSKEVFATHYTSGALALTLLVGNDSSSMRDLIYVNRTWVDAVHWLWRPFVEHRVKSEAAKVFAQARERVESGPAESQ